MVKVSLTNGRSTLELSFIFERCLRLFRFLVPFCSLSDAEPLFLPKFNTNAVGFNFVKGVAISSISDYVKMILIFYLNSYGIDRNIVGGVHHGTKLLLVTTFFHSVVSIKLEQPAQ